MSENPARDERLHLLLSEMLEGRLDAEGAAELGDLLRSDPAARRQYIRQVATHAKLRWIAAPSGIAARAEKPRDECGRNDEG